MSDFELNERWTSLPATPQIRQNFFAKTLDLSDLGGFGPVADADKWFARNEFDLPETSQGRTWLRLEGIPGHAAVWLDQTYIGDALVPFAPSYFEVSALARKGGHVLALDLERPVDGWGFRDDVRQAPVSARLERTGRARITRWKALCVDATNERAVLECAAEIDCLEEGPITLITSVSDASGALVAEHSQTIGTSIGRTRATWAVSVEDPQLWWPAELGHPNMHTVSVSVSTAEDSTSHRVTANTGLRTALVDSRSRLMINGEVLFVRGCALDFGSITPLHSAKVLDTGLNLVAIKAGVAALDFYEEASRNGLLVWQEVPQASDKRATYRARLIRQIVEELGSSASVVAWTVDDSSSARLKTVVPMARRSVERADASRDVITSNAAKAGQIKSLDFHTSQDLAGRISDIRNKRFDPVAAFLANATKTGKLLSDDLIRDAANSVAVTIAEPRFDGRNVFFDVLLINDRRRPLRDTEVALDVLVDRSGKRPRFDGSLQLSTVRHDTAEMKLQLAEDGDDRFGVHHWRWAGDCESNAATTVARVRLPASHVRLPMMASVKVFERQDQPSDAPEPLARAAYRLAFGPRDWRKLLAVTRRPPVVQ